MRHKLCKLCELCCCCCYCWFPLILSCCKEQINMAHTHSEAHLVWHLILSACWGILLCSEKQINKQCRQQTQKGRSPPEMKGARTCSNYKVARETFYDLSTWRQQTRNRQQIADCFMARKSQGVRLWGWGCSKKDENQVLQSRQINVLGQLASVFSSSFPDAICEIRNPEWFFE